MCGIAGFYTYNSTEDLSVVLRAMAREIAHRGPDDEGFYEINSKSEKYRVALAHRRLSIIDLASGHQPMSNEDGSIQIVFNGEIYNFKALREALISCGHKFKTSSDTETIVHAYEEYGESCVNHLNGMFAFAIWDGNKEQIFLARDRFGKKPFYYWLDKGELIFASEIKSLLVHPSLNAQVDRESVFEFISNRYVHGPDTLFEGIKKLPPACSAIFKDGQLEIKKYYSTSEERIFNHKVDLVNPVSDFLSKLDEAVSCRMVSDVQFGAFLSGGIDSSAIVALMTKNSHLPIKTFSVGFNEEEYSELKFAKVVSDHFKTDHQELFISQSHIIDELPKLTRFRDAPVAEPSDIAIYLLAKEASKTVKMVLTGDGSDEFLGGYPKHILEQYVRTYQRIPAFVRHQIIESLIYSLPYKYGRAKTAIASLSLSQWEERMPRWFGALSSEEHFELMNSDVKTMGFRNRKNMDSFVSGSPLRKVLNYDQTSWLPDNLLERGDRMTMAASIEARMPFMDYKLARFISGLPDKYLINGNSKKWILREAMKNLLPNKILNRPKMGLRVPANKWFRGEMKDYLCDHLLDVNSRTRSYYDIAVLERYLKEHISGKQNHKKLLWTLLSLEIWHLEYGMVS